MSATRPAKVSVLVMSVISFPLSCWYSGEATGHMRAPRLTSSAACSSTFGHVHRRQPTPHPLNDAAGQGLRSEEHTSELQSLMRISYAVFCLNKKINL